MTRRHADVSPSYLNSAIPCPASVTLARGVIGKTSQAAREGTLQHALVEAGLEDKPMPAVGDEAVVDGVPVLVTQDMLDRAEKCLHFADLLRHTADIFEVESKLSIGPYYYPDKPPEPFGGFCDLYSYSKKSDTLTVLDWKFGSKKVMPGPQLFAYGAMALLKFDVLPKYVRLVIFQPSLSDENMVSSVRMLSTEIIQWVNDVLDPALRRIAVGDETENPGEEQCLFCKRNGECRALQERALTIAQDAFDDAPVKAGALTDEEISSVLSKLPIVENWMKEVRAEAMARMERGAKVPGYKLVRKLSNRKWSDETSVRNKLAHDDFADLLVDDVFTTPALRSPAQIEKAVKRAGLSFEPLAQLIVREETGFSLALENDGRPEATGDAANFPELKD